MDRAGIVRAVAEFKTDPRNAGQNLADLIGDCAKDKLSRARRYRAMTCAQLLAKIDEIATGSRSGTGSGTKGLADRHAEQITGPSPPGTRGYINHMIQYHNQQVQLRDMIDVYENSHPDDCGGGGGAPPVAVGWAVRPHPDPASWTGPAPGTPMVTARGVILGVGVGYAAYRLLRLLPSLLFPPSLVPNLVAP